MNYLLVVVLALTLNLGCAKMQVGGTKEPIKVDISMRLDIYQHVEKDIDAIESIVSGAPDKGSFFKVFVSEAYAEEGLSPEVEQAALRRRDRLAELSALEVKGVIGENNKGLVEVRGSADMGAEQLVAAENADRMVIYKAVAVKNGALVEEVQQQYTKRLQTNAPAGAPVQQTDGTWTTK